MARKGFTLIELMVVVIIVGILATLGIPAYQGFVEDSKSQVCQNNLLTLKTAMDSYLLDRGVVPADLSQIPGDQIRKAFAQHLREGGLRLRLAYIAVAWDERGYAYADIIDELKKGDLKLLRCPSAAPGENSYGVCEQLLDISPQAYKQLTYPDDAQFGLDPKDIPFIADCASPRFSSTAGLKCRHVKIKPLTPKKEYANVVFQDAMVCGLDRTGAPLFVTSQGETLENQSGQYYPPTYGQTAAATKKTKMLRKFSGSINRFYSTIQAIKNKYKAADG